MTQYTTADLVRVYGMLKKRIETEEALHKARKRSLEIDLEVIEDKLAAHLQRAETENGATSISTPAGTVLYTDKESFSVNDKKAFFGFLQEKFTETPAVIDMLSNTLLLAASKEYLEEADKEWSDSLRTELVRELGRDPTDAELKQMCRERPLPTLPGVKRTRFAKVSVRKK